MISIILAALLSQTTPVDRTYEGKWYVADDTNNNTGEREVSAFRMHLEADDPDYVTLRMRCIGGRPRLLVEWTNRVFPDKVVLTIGAVASPDAAPAEVPYLFEKSEDAVDRGLLATPETTAAIIAALGSAKYATVTAHLTAGAQTVGFEIEGTQQAWSRVTRHCPLRKMPMPAI